LLLLWVFWQLPRARIDHMASRGVDRLYILNCGEGVAGDISRWSGVDAGKSMPMADNCYLIHHAQGWLLWDTGVADAIAAMPDGQAPSDPRAIHWYRPKTLAAELATAGVKKRTHSCGSTMTGRMYAILVAGDRVKPKEEAPTEEERVKLHKSMIAYGGTYTLEPGKVVHLWRWQRNYRERQTFIRPATKQSPHR
jgi:hypothetical protein